MLFDSHMHVGDFPLFGVSLDPEGFANLLKRPDMDGGVVFHPDNALVDAVVERVPNARALYWANPHLPGVAEECERYLATGRFVGVKLHPLLNGFHPDDPMVHPVMEVLRAFGAPVLVHCGHPIFTLPWSIEELARRFPDVPVILGHMGHGNVIYINASIDVAERNSNVYLETSGMPLQTKIPEAVRRVGRDRVLFGSDSPLHDIDVEVLKIQKSGLRDEDLEWVLSRSAQQLFLRG